MPAARLSSREHTTNPATGRHPRAWRLAGASAAAGLLLAILWSFTLVDSVIGGNVASALMGEDVEHLTISSLASGTVFAIVSGLAATFTACNAAAVAAFAPMNELGSRTRQGSRVRGLLAPIGWLTAGMTLVAGSYGFFGVVFSDHLPQLSTQSSIGGVPDRLLQASIVFGIIGLALTWIGLGSLGIVKDGFRGRPTLRVVALGALIGAFLVGRPYPLFNKLFRWAAEEGQPLLGAGIFILQSLGNIALMVVMYALIFYLSRGRAAAWLTSNAQRSQAISGVLLIALGVFTFVYWDFRVPAKFGLGWFPLMPYE